MRAPLPSSLEAVLELVDAGADTPDRLEAAGAEPDGLLLVLAELELRGLLGRGENGRYLPTHAYSPFAYMKQNHSPSETPPPQDDTAASRGFT
jgi:hypothetical protein